MEKCKWCHEHADTLHSGYCESCYQEIRENIKGCKTKLSEILELSKHQPVENRPELIRRAGECRLVLSKYKKAKVPFYKSYKDDEDTISEIYKNLNFDPNPVGTIYTKTDIYVGIPAAIVILLIVLFPLLR